MVWLVIFPLLCSAFVLYLIQKEYSREWRKVLHPANLVVAFGSLVTSEMFGIMIALLLGAVVPEHLTGPEITRLPTSLHSQSAPPDSEATNKEDGYVVTVGAVVVD